MCSNSGRRLFVRMVAKNKTHALDSLQLRLLLLARQRPRIYAASLAQAHGEPNVVKRD
jgi:hypothetical protein